MSVVSMVANLQEQSYSWMSVVSMVANLLQEQSYSWMSVVSMLANLYNWLPVMISLWKLPNTTARYPLRPSVELCLLTLSIDNFACTCHSCTHCKHLFCDLGITTLALWGLLHFFSVWCRYYSEHCACLNIASIASTNEVFCEVRAGYPLHGFLCFCLVNIYVLFMFSCPFGAD